jgi:hypothetical protein
MAASPWAVVLAGANRHDSPLLDATLDRLDALGPLAAHPRTGRPAGVDVDAPTRPALSFAAADLAEPAGADHDVRGCGSSAVVLPSTG